MRVLVTGGAGFIGSHVVEHLLSEINHVLVMDNFTTGTVDNLAQGIEPVIIHTIGSDDPLPEGLKFDSMVHLAAPISVEESLTDAKKYYQQIAYGTDKLMNWAISCGCRNFVLASTAAVYGDTEDFPTSEQCSLYPNSPYAAAKMLMEDIASAYRPSASVAILRFFNVYGERQRNDGGYLSCIPIFMNQYNKQKPLTVTGDGEQSRDFVCVKDVANAISSAIGSSGTWNVGSGREVKIINIAKAISDDIKFIKARKEAKRSLADIESIGFWLNWKPETKLGNWIKSKL